MNYNEFGSNLKKLMKQKGIKVKDISRALLISDAAVYYWLKSEKMPDLANLVSLADILDVTLDELVPRMEIEL